MAISAYGDLSSYNVSAFTGEGARLHETKFLKDVIHKVQEEEDRLRGMFKEKSGAGSEAVRFNFLDKAADPSERTQRFATVFPGSNYGSSVDGDITPSTYNFSERWCHHKIYQDVKYCKKDEDVLSMLNIKSELAASIHKAFNRNRSSVCLNALIGTVYTGAQHSPTAVTLPATQIVDSADLGFTFDKLRQGKYKLDYHDVPDDNRHCFYTAEQLYNAYSILEMTSRDYGAATDLINGKTTQFLGIQMHRVSKDVLPKTGTDRHVILCHGDALGKVVWTGDSNQSIRITQPDVILFDYQITAWEAFNAIRLQEELVVRIDCKENLS